MLTISIQDDFDEFLENQIHYNHLVLQSISNSLNVSVDQISIIKVKKGSVIYEINV